MRDPDPQTDGDPRPKTRKRRRWVWGALVVLGGLAAGGLVALRVGVPVPDSMLARVPAMLSGTLGPDNAIVVSGASIGLDAEFVPHIEVQGLELAQAETGTRFDIARAEVRLDLNALLRREIQPTELLVHGATLQLLRTEDGQFQVLGGPGGAKGSLPQIMAQLDAAFTAPGVSALERIAFEDVGLVLDDRVTATLRRVSDGGAVLERRAGAIAADITFSLPEAGPDATLSLQASLDPAAAGTSFSASLANTSATWLADFAPLPPEIAVRGIEVSAQVDGALTNAGQAERLTGRISAGPGELTLPGAGETVTLEAATADWRLDPQAGKLHVDDLTLSADKIRLGATGYLAAVPVADAPSALLFRLDARDVWADLDPHFSEPVRAAELVLEGQVPSARDRIRFGQMRLHDPDSDAIGRAVGELRRTDAGLAVTLSARSDHIPARRVLPYWPLFLKKSLKTRGWLDRNVIDGALRDVALNLNWLVGTKPKLSLSFDIEEANVRVHRSLPEIVDGSGFATLHNHRFTLSAIGAAMPANAGGRVDLSGTVFQVPDVRIRGGDARLLLKAQGDIAPAYDVLSNPPIAMSEKVRLPVERIAGQVAVETELAIPLRKGAKMDMSALDIDGTIRDLVFADVLPDVDLRADSLALRLESEAARLSGDAQLGGVPLKLELRPSLDAEAGSGTDVTGLVVLSDANLRALSVDLPEGALSGEAEAQFALRLRPETAPELQLSSTLEGARLRVATAGWTKPANAAGQLDLTLRLGPEPEVTSFDLVARDAVASGRIRFGADRRLSVAEFSRLQIGRWLDAAVVLRARAPGEDPAVELVSGTLDLSQLTATGQSTIGLGAPVSLTLDRIRVSEGLSLQAVRGVLLPGNVLNGTLTGAVNGGTRLTVDLAGLNGRQGLRVRGDDAGGVLRSANLLSNMRGGTLEMVLEQSSPGAFSGTLDISGARLMNAPAFAELLSAVSIVGLLDQLQKGQGVVFNEIVTGLTVSRQGVTFRAGRANGPALGITFEGVISPPADRIDLQGVLSPLYVFNRIGEGFSARRGEGLVGFNYLIQGPRSDPAVMVNPLALLTPGVFRELFRRPPPELTQ